ncbi:MAG TPA: 50S ribosomal protein L10 [Thermoflexus sp.]|nr:50S ribosomal protein L10 [Thermoflexus sp.]
MPFTRAEKEQMIARYRELLSRSQALILTDYQGLDAQAMYRLRQKVRKSGGAFQVTKNTLLRIALQQAGWVVPEDLLQGPTAAAFCLEDPPAVAKALLEFAEESKILKIKGGLLDGRRLRPEDVKALSELPPRPVVLGQVLGALQAPAAQLAGVLTAVLQQVVGVLQARADQLKEASQTA